MIDKYDDAITFLLRLLPEMAKILTHKDFKSTLFYKNKYGIMSKEEAAEYDALMYENRLHGAAIRWLPVVRPGLTQEQILDLNETAMATTAVATGIHIFSSFE